MNQTIIGVSGGIDSSAALKALIERGASVYAVTLIMQHNADAQIPSQRDVIKAEKLCHSLGIKHHTQDLHTQFTSCVIDPFINGYLSGITPSPCIVCNQKVKIDALIKIAQQKNATRVCTGHYAATTQYRGKTFIKRAKDATKDQSYYLSALSETQRNFLEFPLAQTHKATLMQKLKETQVESQDICFIRDTTRSEFIQQHAACMPSGEGFIKDESGNVLAKHTGIHNYTIGQRKGLGLSGGPWYVSRINAENDEVIVSHTTPTTRMFFVRPQQDYITADLLNDEQASVQVRYRSTDHKARYTSCADNLIRVEYMDEGHVVSPGQYAAFYKGDILLGGAIIQKEETCYALKS